MFEFSVILSIRFELQNVFVDTFFVFLFEISFHFFGSWLLLALGPWLLVLAPAGLVSGSGSCFLAPAPPPARLSSLWLLILGFWSSWLLASGFRPLALASPGRGGSVLRSWFSFLARGSPGPGSCWFWNLGSC